MLRPILIDVIQFGRRSQIQCETSVRKLCKMYTKILGERMGLGLDISCVQFVYEAYISHVSANVDTSYV